MCSLQSIRTAAQRTYMRHAEFFETELSIETKLVPGMDILACAVVLHGHGSCRARADRVSGKLSDSPLLLIKVYNRINYRLHIPVDSRLQFCLLLSGHAHLLFGSGEDFRSSCLATQTHRHTYRFAELRSWQGEPPTTSTRVM